MRLWYKQIGHDKANYREHADVLYTIDEAFIESKAYLKSLNSV